MKVSSTRVAVILEYLQLGGKVKMDGRTYVWLDNKVVDETETHIFTIDGLATEGRKYKAHEDWNDPNAGEPHYMGCRDLPVDHFFKMIEEIPIDYYKEICVHLFNMRQ